MPFDQARERVRDDPAAVLREATNIFGVGSMRQLNIAMRAWAHWDARAQDAIRRYDEVLMQNLDRIFMALGYDKIAAKSRTLLMMGLATVDIDAAQLQPSYQERWSYIRDHLILPQQS